MTDKSHQISLAELAEHATEVFERVVSEGESIIVENEAGERVIISPAERVPGRHTPSEADYEAFRSAAGGWADVDTDRLKELLYESRKLSTRPPVEL